MNDFEKYSAEAKEKWGQTDAYREYAAKDYSKDKQNALAGEMDGLFAGFASCMSKGYAPDSAEAQDLVKQLQSHISTNYYTCTKEILQVSARCTLLTTASKRTLTATPTVLHTSPAGQSQPTVRNLSK